MTEGTAYFREAGARITANLNIGWGIGKSHVFEQIDISLLFEAFLSERVQWLLSAEVRNPIPRALERWCLFPEVCRPLLLCIIGFPSELRPAPKSRCMSVRALRSRTLRQTSASPKSPPSCMLSCLAAVIVGFRGSVPTSLSKAWGPGELVGEGPA